MDEARVIGHLTAHLPLPIARCVAATAVDPPGATLHDRLRLALRRCIRAHTKADGRPVLHAAAVEIDGEGVLLPGKSRAGKSSLVLAAAQRLRANVASDDLVLVAGSAVVAYGAPVSVRSDSPYASLARSMWYSDDSDRLLVRADDVGAGEVRHRLDVHVIGFPRFGEIDELVRLTPAATFARLLSSLVFPIDHASILELARSIAHLPAVELRYRSSDDALRYLVDQLLDLPPAVPGSVEEVPREELGGFRDAVTGLRFAGDQVVVIHPHRRDVVLFDEWPPGMVPDFPSWSALVGGRA